MALYYITESNWTNFLHFLIKQFVTFSLENNDGQLFWTRVGPEKIAGITINRYRAIHPLKSFFFPLSEEVTHDPPTEKRLLIGAKACDIKHLAVMDQMFNGGVVPDPYYASRRSNTLIISADCDAYLPGCFCTSMGGLPFSASGFDMNLSRVRAGFIVETGTRACEELIRSKKHLFQDPQSYHLQERQHIREKMTQAVRENNEGFTWKDPASLLTDTYRSDHWTTDIAGTCVECDACRFNCGTCYCFLLGETATKWEKQRTWDSCQSAGYGRVAGGGNPRKHRYERLRNFYVCKMVYRKENFGVYACTGCGRCIEVCQGKIDIRKSLQKLYDRMPQSL